MYKWGKGGVWCIVDFTVVERCATFLFTLSSIHSNSQASIVDGSCDCTIE